MNMDFYRKLAIPVEVKEMFPITRLVSETMEKKVLEIKQILDGRSSRLLLIIGPCSADCEDSVLDYISRLVPVQEKVKDKIMIVPRIYTNKPRTTGEGYKGLLHQPDPTDKPDLFKGLIAVRELHMRVVAETGFGCADEMLYPDNHKYLDDILVYVAVGARSVENQEHRLTASGIEVPVGMKNPTGGDFSVMMNAITAAHHQHTFIYRGWETHSFGNPYAHAILRGYTDKHRQHHPNYHYEDLELLCDFFDRYELPNPAALVDTNHSNSGKDPFRQPLIIREVLQNRRFNTRIEKLIKGFMVESYIESGSQPVGGGCYGQSITDPCLGWKETEEMIYRMADML
ncbi:MAG: 3-deoxy-7-phosphoheptulonate synthase [Abditibacteriota bacterium]|nr:3-deoxy-7-phosphoheptulonate synthase [Abditibacteriota bacterium]